MKKKYQHVFFDLDHTLWDFEKNSAETLHEIFSVLKLAEAGVDDQKKFIERYHVHNENLWALYQLGKIERDDLRYLRWSKTLSEFGITNDALVQNLGDEYLNLLPEKMHLFSDTIEVLDYLKPKYHLHIITNGFEEIQFKKIRNSGIDIYFNYVITSEKAGYQKPHPLIFEHAFQLTNADKLSSIFIGDSIEADIAGAKAVGMDYVYYNPKKKQHTETVMHEIASLTELKKIL